MKIVNSFVLFFTFITSKLLIEKGWWHFIFPLAWVTLLHVIVTVSRSFAIHSKCVRRVLSSLCRVVNARSLSAKLCRNNFLRTVRYSAIGIHYTATRAFALLKISESVNVFLMRVALVIFVALWPFASMDFITNKSPWQQKFNKLLAQNFKF